ncbi:MAG: hypothetical protein WBR17_03550 [Paraburkholderia sp.]|uniref:hypothetical protein n=1 Tax=Paraburkholderia sp. TaxID=1926495 RepID=UPI003C3810E2
MIESFAEYAIAHEAGHAVVGQFVRIAAPHAISFRLVHGPDGNLCLGDFATSSLFPPDHQIAALPIEVKRCLCYFVAAGLAATQFSGVSIPDENQGLNSDRHRLSKLTSESLESFLPYARAVIEREARAYRAVVSECRRRYEQLKTTNVEPSEQYLLTAQELEAIFKRTMSPLSAPLPVTEDTIEFREMMSAHEAGHATVGVTLGARVEAVYAIYTAKLPNGDARLAYLTKFGSFEKAGLDLKDKILLVAGGAAGEFLLNGRWDHDCVEHDRMVLEELGFSNFDYCATQAIEVLRQNNPLLIEIRDRIYRSMTNLKDCTVARKSHISLAKGSEIEKLFRALGFRAISSSLDLETARSGMTPGIST